MVQHIQTTPPTWGLGLPKVDNNVKNTIWKSTMNEHFSFKLKGPIGQVQI